MIGKYLAREKTIRKRTRELVINNTKKHGKKIKLLVFYFAQIKK